MIYIWISKWFHINVNLFYLNRTNKSLNYHFLIKYRTEILLQKKHLSDCSEDIDVYSCLTAVLDRYVDV